MADINSLSDIREEGPATSAAANQDTVGFLDANIPPSSAPPSPNIPGRKPRRMSRVDIGHFDPTGVDELRRTMSRMSLEPPGDDVEKGKKGTSVFSDVTLAMGDGPFDFEKCLRAVMKK
jgi:ATP-binding cassette subfamily G (WHITE) protein 2 (SNQ2)